MNIFSIKNETKIFKLNEKNYERATDRKEPYYKTIKGEKKYYALCPECNNPIIIVNLYVNKTIDNDKKQIVLHGRHYKNNVTGLNPYNEENYNNCSLANPESFSSSTKRNKNLSINNEIIQIINDYPELLLNFIRNISGINIYEALFEKMLRNFKESKGYMYKYVTKFNLPYSFLFMSDNIDIIFQFLMKNQLGIEIKNAIMKKSEYFEIINNQIKPKSKKYANIGLYFSNHKILTTGSETMDLIIKETLNDNINDILIHNITIEKELYPNIILKQYRLKQLVKQVFEA